MDNVQTKEKDKLFNFRPLLFAAIFLILGIVFAYYRLTKGASLRWLFAFVPAALLSFYFCGSWRAAYIRFLAWVALLICFWAGFIAFRSQIYAYTDCARYEGEVVVIGTVESKAAAKGEAALTLRDLYIDGEETEGRLVAYLPYTYGEELHLADEVLLVGTIVTDTEIVDENGFRDNAIGKKLRYTVYAYEPCIKVGKSDSLSLKIRARMEEVLYVGMDETPAALTLALLTGDISGVEEDLMDNMRYGGISHIFAVSGLNVGALYLFCLLIFSKTFLRRAPKWLRLCLLVGILTGYTAICGFTASVVRAALMCAVGDFVRLLGTGGDMLEGLGFSAIILLLLCPSELFGVGFQLSYLACLGLFLWTKPIGQVFDEGQKVFRKYFPQKRTEEEEKWLAQGNTLPLGVRDKAYAGVRTLLSASLAAQIATIPALLFHFDRVSGWALLLNFFFVPFTDGLFTFLLVLAFAACCLPTAFSILLLRLPSVLWSAAILVFEVVDFSTFALTGVQITLGFCVCYYGGLSFLTDKWNLSRRMKLSLACLLFFGVLVGALR